MAKPAFGKSNKISSKVAALMLRGAQGRRDPDIPHHPSTVPGTAMHPGGPDGGASAEGGGESGEVDPGELHPAAHAVASDLIEAINRKDKHAVAMALHRHHKMQTTGNVGEGGQIGGEGERRSSEE